jgi:glycosidase
LFEGFTNPDDLVRQEFKGGWKGDSIDYFKQINITTQEREAFDFYTHLTQLRNKHQWGTMSLKQFVPEDNIYVYFRYNEKKTYMMVVNLGEKNNIELSRFQEMLQKGTKMTSLISAKEYAAQGILDWSKGQAFDIFELTTTPLPSK